MNSHEAWRQLQQEHQRLRDLPSDIHEHLDTLSVLAGRVEHVTEFGVRDVVSTIGLLCGRPRAMVSYDTYRSPRVPWLINLCHHAGADWTFREEDVLDAEPVETDLLFIDTLHTYAQLTAELERHSGGVSTYIVLHDTTTFGDRGEDGTTPGIWRATEQFLASHGHWSLRARFTNNNGLTVLERVG